MKTLKNFIATLVGGILSLPFIAAAPVSYTHLDVYKRQGVFSCHGIICQSGYCIPLLLLY